LSRISSTKGLENLRAKEIRRLHIRAYAKVNLFLEVVGKRADGFHEIETVFAQVDLSDGLAFSATDSCGIDLKCAGLPVPAGKENIVYKAVQLLRTRYRLTKGVRIELEKKIPAGSGLGGGSSDAAAALRALNTLWRLGLDEKELRSLALELGSDVPFFLLGGVALGRGRGEILQPVKCKKQLHLVLVFPHLAASTRSVYEAFDRDAAVRRVRSSRPICDALGSGDIERLRSSIFNRLKKPALKLYPRLRSFERNLKRVVRRPLGFSGSGSTFFVICESRREAAETGNLLKRAGIDCLLVRTLSPRS
jgi:4-diphosphocytidyl-2-C-methyl-D-erythritol kinase